MGEPCEVFFDREEYYPGETVRGRVECDFSEEMNIKGIRVKFRGRAKVYWKEGRYTTYSAQEVFFDADSELIGETTFQPGLYTYPFSHKLPKGLPSSMNDIHGNIKYTVQATVDNPWPKDYQSKKEYTLCSYHDLNATDTVNKPVEYFEEKAPFSLFTQTGPIKISLSMPISGYVPSQTIHFSTKVKNDSNTTIESVNFRLVQGFIFHAEERTKTIDTMAGEQYIIEGSAIEPGRERSWDLKLTVPAEMFVGCLEACNIIKVFWDLRGEAVLPFPNSNLSIKAPVILGAVPLTGTSI